MNQIQRTDGQFCPPAQEVIQLNCAEALRKTQDWAQQYSALPPEIKSLKAWLLWKYVQGVGDAKPQKIPVYASGSPRRKHGTPEDVAQLVTFGEALRVLQAGSTYTGLGLATLPQWGLVALDFDNCIVGGKVMPEVERLIAGAYCETSPSGKGVRAIMRGELRNHKSPSTEAQFGFETFHSKGFVTITGNRLEICDFLGGDIVDITPGVLDFCRKRFGDERPAVPPSPREYSIENGPNFEFNAKIPGKMSGSPILVGGGIITKGVVSRSLGSNDNHASGCLIATMMSLPLVEKKSLLDLMKDGKHGIAQFRGSGL